MSIEKRTGNEIPRPKLGKTHRYNRWTRFVDLNEYVDKLVDYTDANFVALPESPNNGDVLIYDSTTNSWVNSVSSDNGLEGTQYVYVQANGTDTENATELQEAYNTAKTMSPSATNRITVVCGLGNYNFSSNFVMDGEHIDLVSLDGNRSIIFNGTGTISITANDVFVKGVDVGSKNFTIGDDLNLLRVENCIGGLYSFGGEVTASGTFTDCQGGTAAFGGEGTASGIFTNCQGGTAAFGGSGTASGTFKNCIGESGSFGGEGGAASGTFKNCQGGGGSFGGFGTLSGKLYYCRLTSGTFQTVSLAGLTRLCIDGNNNENNQG